MQSSPCILLHFNFDIFDAPFQLFLLILKLLAMLGQMPCKARRRKVSIIHGIFLFEAFVTVYTWGDTGSFISLSNPPDFVVVFFEDLGHLFLDVSIFDQCWFVRDMKMVLIATTTWQLVEIGGSWGLSVIRRRFVSSFMGRRMVELVLGFIIFSLGLLVDFALIQITYRGRNII